MNKTIIIISKNTKRRLKNLAKGVNIMSRVKCRCNKNSRLVRLFDVVYRCDDCEQSLVVSRGLEDEDKLVILCLNHIHQPIVMEPIKENSEIYKCNECGYEVIDVK